MRALIRLSAFTPLVANVALTAALGTAPVDVQLTRKAVGQAVAAPGLDAQFVAVMLDAVCSVVAATAEHLALGAGGADQPQFVDATLLLAAA